MYKMLSKKTLLFGLKLAVTVGLVWFLVVGIDWVGVWSVMREMSVWLVVVYALVILVSIGISSYKWRQIAQVGGFAQNKQNRQDGQGGYSAWQYFRWYYGGVFLNNFFPGFLGGDTYRTISLAGEGKQFAQASATVVLDRITGLFAFLVLGAVFGTVAWVQNGDWFYLVTTLILLVGILVLLIVFIGRKWIGRHRYLPGILRKYLAVFEVYDRVALTRALVWSVVFALIGVALANYILFLAAGVVLSPILYLALIFPINILIAVPISIGNIGTKEWAYIAIFGMIGVVSQTALAVVLVGRVVQMIISLGAAPMFLRKF